MNDNTKVLDQNPVPPPVSSSVVQPYGSLNKEAPIGQNLSEVVRPAGTEASPNVSEEERKSGVEIKRDKPNLTLEHNGLVEHAGPHVSVSTQPSGKITMPMSEEEIARQLKTGRDDDSEKWLAWLLKKVIAWGRRNI